MREAATWCLVAVAGFASVYYFDDVVARLTPPGSAAVETAAREREPVEPAGGGSERSVRLRADQRGHFAVSAFINDRPVTMMADTGATAVVLTYEDARGVGILPGEIQYSQRTQTANGIARVAPVTLGRVRVGDIELRDVRALVAEPGRLHVNLLGMTFLGALTRIELRGRELVLVQ